MTTSVEAELKPLYAAHFDGERLAVIVSGMAPRDQRIIGTPGFGLGSYVVSHERLSDPNEDRVERKHPAYRSIASQTFKLPGVKGFTYETGTDGKTDWVIRVDDQDGAYTVMGWISETFAAVYAERAKSERNLRSSL